MAETLKFRPFGFLAHSKTAKRIARATERRKQREIDAAYSERARQRRKEAKRARARARGEEELARLRKEGVVVSLRLNPS